MSTSPGGLVGCSVVMPLHVCDTGDVTPLESLKGHIGIRLRTAANIPANIPDRLVTVEDEQTTCHNSPAFSWGFDGVCFHQEESNMHEIVVSGDTMPSLVHLLSSIMGKGKWEGVGNGNGWEGHEELKCKERWSVNTISVEFDPACPHLRIAST